jgi:hypothetical protein
VKRILAGEAPANLVELLLRYFGLTEDVWGKDIAAGNYRWLNKLAHNRKSAGNSGGSEV